MERDAGEDLQPFGFQGWEAHCEGDWYQRSLQTTSEAVEYMRRRQSVMSAQSLRGSQPPPWALVVSYPDIMPNLAEAGVCRDIVECDGETGRVRARSEDREDGFHGAGETRPTVQRRFVEHCQNVGEAAISEEFEENAKRLDQLLGELLQEVLRSDGGDTVIVVTASNGNCEGDHGLWGCCYNAYDRSIHVPCLLYLPSQFYAQQRALQQQALSAMTSSDRPPPHAAAPHGVDREELRDVNRRHAQKGARSGSAATSASRGTGRSAACTTRTRTSPCRCRAQPRCRCCRRCSRRRRRATSRWCCDGRWRRWCRSCADGR